MKAEALAKINLGLRIGRIREDGFHTVDGIFQSIEIVDRLGLASDEVDTIVKSDGSPVVERMNNLAFRAVAAVRAEVGSDQPLRVTLDKTIPAAAGLGGGSADAAAALGLAGRYFGVKDSLLTALAPRLGSDVPFCFVGGTARVSGRGELIDRLDALDGFAVGVVVPPVEISTPDAFRRWDEMDEPAGLRMSQAALPPALRGEGDLVNDLYPAAVGISPELDDWRFALEASWSRPVMLSGSGPSLFGFFLDEEEAADAATSIPAGARFAEGCGLAPVGWRTTDGS